VELDLVHTGMREKREKNVVVTLQISERDISVLVNTGLDKGNSF
jgi:hypothetical protein